MSRRIFDRIQNSDVKSLEIYLAFSFCRKKRIKDRNREIEKHLTLKQATSDLNRNLETTGNGLDATLKGEILSLG